MIHTTLKKLQAMANLLERNIVANRKFADIASCCLRLSLECIPSSSDYDDDGIMRYDGHHGGTRLAMEWALGRPLTDLELTCLSLGRCYGPTPSLSADDREHLMGQLWPEGNHHGGWLDWEDLAESVEYGLAAYR